MNDDRRIGNNVKIIRKSYGIKQETMANNLHISLDTYEKYENGRRPFRHEYIVEISKITGIPVNVILNGDLSDVLCNIDRSYSSGIKISDKLKELNNPILDILSSFFPFVSVVTDSKYFNNTSALTKKIDLLDYNSIIELITNSMKAYREDGIIEGAVNALSAFGYLWVHQYIECINFEKINSFLKCEIYSDYDLNKTLLSSIDSDKLNIYRREFLNNYDDYLYDYIKAVRNDINYYDFAYYYLAIRYLICLYDKTSNDFTDEDSYMIGIELLSTISCIGNKYAINLIKKIKKS